MSAYILTASPERIGPMTDTRKYIANGPVCGCCGSATIPPTHGTEEEGFYCESCGAAWGDPTLVIGPCVVHRS